MYLRPVLESDYLGIRLMEQASGTIGRYRHRGGTISPEGFPASLWSGVVCQFVVCEKTTSKAIGVVAGYAMDARNGHCKIAGLVDASLAGRGWPAEGIELLLDHLFVEFPLRKVYAEVLEPNLAQFGSVANSIAKEEGCLAGHEYLGGEYVSLHILSVARESWEASKYHRPGLALARSHTRSSPSSDLTLREGSFPTFAEFSVAMDELVQRHLSLTPDTPLESLGLDSLHWLEISVSLSELAGRDIEAELVDALITANDLYHYLKSVQE